MSRAPRITVDQRRRKWQPSNMARIAAPLADNVNAPTGIRTDVCPRCGEGNVPEGLRAHDICPQAQVPTDAHNDLRLAVKGYEDSDAWGVDELADDAVSSGDVTVERLIELYNELRGCTKALADAAQDVLDQDEGEKTP